VDEINRIRLFRTDVSEPSAQVVSAARDALFAAIDSPPRRRRWAPRSRRTLVAAVAVACLLGCAGALAASGVLGDGILGGPSAPPENDAALRALFPPYRIGHAMKLAEHQGRKLFGARTASGGYCFSATSPTDPKGEGGHCVSKPEARTLDAGGTVAFAMSGWSVGGYAPGATSVRVSGAGIDVTVPVEANGWWLGVAKLAELPKDPLPDGQDSALVVASSIGPDGRVIGKDPLMLVTVTRTATGRILTIGIAVN
jgi:hypothetical protein